MQIDIKYSHVFDLDPNNPNRKIVNINDVTSDNKQSVYYSLGTGLEMEAVLGDKNRHYFRHIRGAEYNPETELHMFAKVWFKHLFDSEENFPVFYMIHKQCKGIERCAFSRELINTDICLSHEYLKVDLKQYYDTATIEGTYGGFVADVLLTHSQYPNRKPVFIEICITHPCSQEKIESGNKIIEITLKSETDISFPIQEDDCINQLSRQKRNNKIQCFNFEREKIYKLCGKYVESFFTPKKFIDNCVNSSRLETYFFCAPDEFGDRPLFDYERQLKIGAIFCSNKYLKAAVYDWAINPIKKTLVVMACDPDAICSWVVYSISYQEGKYYHDYIGNYMDMESALKYFTLEQGKKWIGGEVLYDRM